MAVNQLEWSFAEKLMRAIVEPSKSAKYSVISNKSDLFPINGACSFAGFTPRIPFSHIRPTSRFSKFESNFSKRFSRRFLFMSMPSVFDGITVTRRNDRSSYWNEILDFWCLSAWLWARRHRLGMTRLPWLPFHFETGFWNVSFDHGLSGDPSPLPVQFLGMWRHITSQTRPPKSISQCAESSRFFQS